MEPGRMHRRTSSLTSLGVAFLVVVSGCGGSSETTQTGAGGAGNGTAGGGPGGSQAPGGNGAPAGAGGQRRAVSAAAAVRRAAAPAAAQPAAAAAHGWDAGQRRRDSTGGAETYPVPAQPPADEDGSQLWLRYPKVALAGRLAEYQAALTHVVKAGSSATLQAAQAELVKGLGGLLGRDDPRRRTQPTGDGAVVLGTPASSTIVSGLALGSRLTAVGSEGYLVKATTVGGKDGDRRRRATPTSACCTAPSRCCATCRCTPARGAGAQRVAQDQAPHPQSLGQPGRHRRARLRRAARSGTGAACRRRSRSATRTTRAPTRRSASTAPCSTTSTPNAQILTSRVPGQGRRAGDGVPPLRDRRLPVRALQRARARSAASPPPIRRTAPSRPGGRTRSTRSTRRSPTSAGSW